ncbi:MAG: CoA transferase [Alphaproteobacteria bacterium]|nr:CoA transferase [Alphaproteobacteria bacterium]
MPSAGPLAGIRVIDFTRVLAGPYCTMTLGDLGAEVIKVESPAGGDDTRNFRPPEVGGESTYFLMMNRNKKSLALDIAKPEGQAVVRDLVAGADVVIENFRTGVMARRGLDYASLALVNPRLVYCSISGYGRTGPFAERAGYDPIVQAEAGFMALNGEPDGEPLRTGISIMDIITGLFAAQAILAAIIQRGPTGEGQRIDVPLYDTALNMLGQAASAYLNTGHVMGRAGNSNLVAQPVGAFECADGLVMLAMTTDALFRRFADEVLGDASFARRPEFADNSARLANRALLTAELNRILKGDRRDAWIAKARMAGIPAGPIRGVDEALDSDETRRRELIVAMDHPTAGRVKGLASPMHLSKTPVREPVAAPLLGQHTALVLSEVAGYDPARIQALVAAGVVPSSAIEVE